MELTHGSQVPPDTAWVTAGWHSCDSAEGSGRRLELLELREQWDNRSQL